MYRRNQRELLHDLNITAEKQLKAARLNNMLQAASMAQNHANHRELIDKIEDANNRTVSEIKNLNSAMRKIGSEVNGKLEAQNVILDAIRADQRHYGEVAANQQYSRWRQENEHGRAYHYDYLPNAKRYIDSCLSASDAWTMLVREALRVEVMRFTKWKYSHWLPDALQTGIFIAPPKEPPVPAAPVLKEYPSGFSDSKRKTARILVAILAFFISVMGLAAVMIIPVGILSLMGVDMAPDSSTSKVFRFFIFAVPIAVTVYCDSLVRKHFDKATKDIDEWNVNARANYRDARSEYENTVRENWASWERANREAMLEAERRFIGLVGVDISRKGWESQWMDPGDFKQFADINSFIKSGRDMLPAIDEFVPVPPLRYREDLPERYRRSMQSYIDSLVRADLAP
ncbi:hypothetical protein [Corynebacterium lowii]|nr:hypothetical protein [Corynebacterium lowii]MDP9852795.1 hypothetical protein [Corynebacterium lowii]